MGTDTMDRDFGRIPARGVPGLLGEYFYDSLLDICQEPSGRLIQGYNLGAEHAVNELTTDAELSALLST